MKTFVLLTACVLVVLTLVDGSESGYAQALPGAPTIATVVAGTNTLTVIWVAPSDDGGSTITSYNLRYIETDATDKADANWPVEQDIWSSGSLTYELPGVRDSTGYDVKVQAVNGNGPGAWSDISSAVTSDYLATISGTTDLPMGGSLLGRISPVDDVDRFRFVLTEETDFWVYSTGELDTYAWLSRETADGTKRLGSNDTGLLLHNPLSFSMRARLSAGTYAVGVQSSGQAYAGAYAIHLEVVTDPGHSLETATPIELDSFHHGRVGNAEALDGDDDYFSFTLSETTDIWFVAFRVTSELLNAQGAVLESTASHYPYTFPGGSSGSPIRRELGPGTYYIRTYINITSTSGKPTSARYILFLRTATEPGTATATATPLSPSLAQAGRISSSSDEDYFSITLAEESHLFVDVLTLRARLPLEATASHEGTAISLYTIPYSTITRYSSVPVLGMRLWGKFPAGTSHVKVRAPQGDPGRYLILTYPDKDYNEFFEDCSTIATAKNDLFYGCQWHLNGARPTYSPTETINIDSAWSITLGDGVTVAIIDDSLHYEHEDLKDNVLTGMNQDAGGGDSSRVFNPFKSHGTLVAGIIAARDNDLGVRGVAPRASIYAYNLHSHYDDDTATTAMTVHIDETAVSNNSWAQGGLEGLVGLAPMPATWTAAVRRGVESGYGGKGVFYVFAAGNYSTFTNANFDELNTTFAVTVVCAINYLDARASYSETGANLWICAPSGDSNVPRITTTTVGHRYTDQFAGTSASAPIVSGVAALVRAANPKLTWRDVKLILAGSARKNDPANTGWEEGALKYGSASERYSFNHEFGFGAVDAGAAVALAQNWTPLPPMRELEVEADDTNIDIPDLENGGSPTTVTSTVALPPYIEFVEFVELNVDWDHDSIRDLDIELVSPSGAVSIIGVGETGIKGIGYYEAFRFGSARHLGEDAEGEWTLRIRDVHEELGGSVRSWSLRVYGHGLVPGLLDAPSATPGGGAITVAWDAPDDTGGPAITGYDLRYIGSDATDRADANWTAHTGVWTSGPLIYEIAGLGSEFAYDLQVRAVNTHGHGPWSESVTATTGAVRLESPTINSVEPRTNGLAVAWAAPPGTGVGSVSAYDVRYIESDAIDTTDRRTYWTEQHDAWSPGGGDLRYVVRGLENGEQYDVQVRGVNRIGDGAWSATQTGTPETTNSAPEFPLSGSYLSSVPESAGPGMNIGAPIDARDDEGDTLTYALGSHENIFGIVDTSGQLRTSAALDHESTPSYLVTVTVSDGKAADGAVDTTIDDSAEVTIAIADVNERPEVVGPTTATWPETQDLRMPVASYRVVDPDNDAGTGWSVGGPDGGPFAMNGVGGLYFLSKPNFESPTDQDGNNSYLVTVSNTAGGHSGALDVIITVTNVDEPPTITGASNVYHHENRPNPIATYSASDPDAVITFTWSLSGTDEDDFTINSNGELSFVSGPDYEAPTDYNTDNDYSIVVVASHGSTAVTKDVIISVLDEAEPPKISGPRDVAIEEDGATFVGSYTADDPEGQTATWELPSGPDAGDFLFDRTTGELNLVNVPDFGTPTDANRDNVYHITLRSSDGTYVGTFDVFVTITNMQEQPVITGPSDVELAENSGTRVGTYSATDPDYPTATDVTLELAGTDAGAFALIGSGVLSFKVTPDYEDKRDQDRNNVYEVIVRAIDRDSAVTDRAVTITVTPVNEPPTLTGPTLDNYDENDARPITPSYTVVDPDAGDTITWSLSGTHRNSFSIAYGVVRFVDPPDYEARSSYSVGVTATDSAGLLDTINLTVNVRDVNEPPVLTVIAEPDPLEIAEKTPVTNPVARYSATDPDAGDTYNWALSGTDADDFSITNGALMFATTRDYESATDSNRDNVYLVTVEADDGEASASRSITVTVTNEDEPGELEFSSDQPQVGTALIVTLIDPDGNVSGQTWTWYHSRCAGTAIGSGFGSYTPVDADRSRFLCVKVDYTDGHGSGKEATARTTKSTRLAPVNNRPPAFSSPAMDRSVAENTAEGGNVGAAVVATDPDNDDLKYELSGNDASRFEIHEDTGRTRVGANTVLDHETRDSYTVTVTASDPSTESDTTSVTIMVTDVNERPLAVRDAVAVEEDSGVTVNLATLLANDTDDDDDTLTITRHTNGRHGSVMRDANAITYTVTTSNYNGSDSFTYTVSDGEYPSTATVSVLILPVNDPPVFTDGATTTRSVASSAPAGTEVGSPVTATDVDGDTLRYSLSSADFAINEFSGQVTVRPGRTLTPGDITVVVTVDDQSGASTATATIVVTATVTTGPVRPPVITGGGGGGGGPSGPSPSEVDFEWTVKRDIEKLDHDHDIPSGMWSDGTTLWLAENGDGADDAIYAYDLKTGERVEEREFGLDERNRAPRGVWSDRTTIWVSDSGQNRLFAHDLGSGDRLPDSDIELAARNRDARAIWSDGRTMWVLDGGKNSLFAYDLATGDSLAEYALDSTNGDPRGIWSDGTTVWVSDHGAKRLFAYRLFVPEDTSRETDEEQTLKRVKDEEFGELSRASNNSPRGIWSDGDVMYVADESDGKVYSYNMPDAIDARLATLTLSGVDFGEFDPGRPDYEGSVVEGVTQTTVDAEAMQRRTDVDIHPPDADLEADSYQVALEHLSEITVTVTSADGSRKKTYRVAVVRPSVELTLDSSWNRLQWPIDDGTAVVDALREGGISERVLVVYEWDEDTRTWLAFFPGLDDIPGINTLTTLSEGRTYWAAVTEPLTWTVATGKPAAR